MATTKKANVNYYVASNKLFIYINIMSFLGRLMRRNLNNLVYYYYVTKNRIIIYFGGLNYRIL